MAIRGHSRLLVVIQGDSWPLAFTRGHLRLFMVIRGHS